jgi:hypothetical protein
MSNPASGRFAVYDIQTATTENDHEIALREVLEFKSQAENAAYMPSTEGREMARYYSVLVIDLDTGRIV